MFRNNLTKPAQTQANIIYGKTVNWIADLAETDWKVKSDFIPETDKITKAKQLKLIINDRYHKQMEQAVKELSNYIELKKQEILKVKYSGNNVPAENSAAILFVQNLPSNFLPILTTAIQAKRYSFFFFVYDLITNDKTKIAERAGLTRLYEQLCKDLNIAELNQQIIELTEILEVVNETVRVLLTQAGNNSLNRDMFNTNTLEMLNGYNKPLYDRLLAEKYPSYVKAGE